MWARWGRGEWVPSIPGAELLSHRRILSRLPESPLGSHSPGFLLFTDDFTDRRDTFMSCDHVDTLLRSVCLCVFWGWLRPQEGARRGGMSGQIPGFRATSGRGARPKPQAAREWTKGTFSCDALSEGAWLLPSLANNPEVEEMR